MLLTLRDCGLGRASLLLNKGFDIEARATFGYIQADTSHEHRHESEVPSSTLFLSIYTFRSYLVDDQLAQKECS